MSDETLSLQTGQGQAIDTPDGPQDGSGPRSAILGQALNENNAAARLDDAESDDTGT